MEKPLDIFQDPLMRRVIGGLKSAINDHGPVTRELISSAAKRIYGNIREIHNACTVEKLSGPDVPVDETVESDRGSVVARPRTVSELVKGTTVEFICYRDGELWYRVLYGPKDVDGSCLACGEALVLDHLCPGFFEFPIPISDTGSGIFSREMKAITLMRWIRKYLEVQKTWNQP